MTRSKRDLLPMSAEEKERTLLKAPPILKKNYKNKIPAEDLLRLVRDGVSIAEIARRYKMGWEAVKRRIDRIENKLAIYPDPTKSDLSRNNIDTVTQLNRMNTAVLLELDRCRKLIDREDRTVTSYLKLEKQVDENPENTELVEKLRKHKGIDIKTILALQAGVISISGEVRRQIELQVKIFETAYNVQMVAEFQEEVLEILRSVDPKLRDEAIARLKRRRSMRGLLRSGN